MKAQVHKLLGLPMRLRPQAFAARTPAAAAYYDPGPPVLKTQARLVVQLPACAAGRFHAGRGHRFARAAHCG